MRWKKLGRIFDPVLISSKNLTHALMPIVEVMDEENDVLRVYFCPRTTDSKSKLYYFDFNLNDLSTIIRVSDSALLTEGILGTFDDCGVTSGSLCHVGDQKALYYTGWSLTKTVPMNNSIGIAFYNKELNLFERIGHGPIMTRTLNEPYSCASPFVLRDSDKYKMWYASMDFWKEVQGEPKHFYNLKYAESMDGINWDRQSRVALTYANDQEYAFGRPFVLKDGGTYKMWYAFRGDNYVIGYAESDDGVNWKRLDHLAGIKVSDEGWDSEMIEFPFILNFKQRKYMFYNGNGFGFTGIGLAVLEEE